MKRSKLFRLFAAAAALLMVVSLIGCSAAPADNGATEENAESVGESGVMPAEEESGTGSYYYEDEEEFPQEYQVTKYETEDNVFKVKGELNDYVYVQLPGAEKFIDVLNEEFGIDLQPDPALDDDDGYNNWFYSPEDEENGSSASVSGSTITGKFSFCLAPTKDSTADAAGDRELDIKAVEKIADEFAAKFEFITGKLTRQSEKAVDDLYYTNFSDDGELLKDLNVYGIRFYYVSEENSRQILTAQKGLKCSVECGDSSIEDTSVQYFVVTVWHDGTVVNADNYITKAKIKKAGVTRALDAGDLDEMLTYFTSTTEDDTMVIKSIYVDSYSNYFGHAEIQPVTKVEYYFKSAPDDVRTTEMITEGLIG